MARPALATSGLALGLRALIGKELRSRSRGLRSMWVLTIYLLLLTLLICGFLQLVGQSGGTTPTRLGTWLFSSLAMGSLFLLAFITPALTAGAISGERERRTLDLLLITRASPLGLVTGKLVGSLAYVVYLVIASLPGFALVYLFGGVPIHYLIMAVAVILTTAVTHAAIGLLLSAVLKRTVLATVGTYFIVLALVLGIPFISLALSIAAMANQGGAYPYGPGRSYSGPGTPDAASGSPPTVLVPPGAYVLASPIISMASVLPSEMGGSSVPMVGSMVQMAFGGRVGSSGGNLPFTHSTYALSGYAGFSGYPASSGDSVVAFAPWVYHFVFSWTIVLVCLGLAALAIAPVKPWRAAASRRRLRKQAAVPAPS
jgi:ABC-type transport system involved in multi-copper enzyme maturation permease subunit